MLYNELSGSVLATEVKEATTFLSRLRGLMFVPGLAEGTAVLFAPCRAVHTCFMRFAIDVAFVDRDMRVVGVLHSMPPWRFGKVYKDAWAAVELPAGVLERTDIRVGDRIGIRR